MHVKLSDNVFLIDTLALARPRLVACYLVKGERSALIDAGYPSSADTLLRELRSIDLDAPQVDYLIATHVHLDHAGAIGHLAQAMPKAKILVSKHGAKHLVDPTRLMQSAGEVLGDEFMSLIGNPLRVPADRIERIDAPYALDLGADKRLRIFWTPGHAWHHVSVLMEGEGILFTGDAAGVRHADDGDPIPATPPPSFDPDHYARTIAAFMQMDPKELLLSHFGVVEKNVKGFLESNRSTLQNWLSQAHEVVRDGGSFDSLYNSFVVDIMTRTGRSRDMIPQDIAQIILFTAKGLYEYALSQGGRPKSSVRSSSHPGSRTVGCQRLVSANRNTGLHR